MSTTTQTQPARRLTDLYSPRGIFKGTREEWLEVAANTLGKWIDEEMNGSYPGVTPNRFTRKVFLSNKYGFTPSSYTFAKQNLKYSCSLMSGGITGSKTSGEAAHIHYKHATGNTFDEIRLSVELGGRKLEADSCRVADVLLHEIIHSLCPFAGHKGPFKYIALLMGLTGKMTATRATPELTKRIKENIVDVIGKYPHAKVHLVPRGQRGKGSRSIKCQCSNPDCLFTMRTTRKWIEIAEFNLVCPICHDDNMMIEGVGLGVEEE